MANLINTFTFINYDSRQYRQFSSYYAYRVVIYNRKYVDKIGHRTIGTYAMNVDTV